MSNYLRFKFDYVKCVEAIHYLAAHHDGITQYYLGKVMFFADRAHISDWGRPIFGDRYVAMEHGPVPSTTLNIVKSDSDEPDEIEEAFSSRIEVRNSGNRRHLHARPGAPAITQLSESDKEYLLNSLLSYGHKSFSKIREESHEDIAYSTAWAKPGLNNEMDIRLWLNEDQQMSLDQSSFVQRQSAY